MYINKTLQYKPSVLHIFIDEEAHVGKQTCCSKAGSQQCDECGGNT